LVATGRVRGVSGDRVQNLLNRIERELEPLATKEALARWRWWTHPDSASKARYLAAREEKRAYLAQGSLGREIDAALSGAGEALHPLFRRQAELIRRLFFRHQVVPEVGARINALEVELEAMRARVPEVDPVPACLGLSGSGASEEALETAVAAGRAAAPVLVELVRLRNKVAQSLGYADYYELSLRLNDAEEKRVFAALSRLEKETEPAVRKLKAERPPGVEAIHSLFAGQDLTCVAGRYFDAIGLAVDRVLARSDLGGGGETFGRPLCIDIDRAGDVRIAAKLSPGFEGALRLLHFLGRAVYRLNIASELPYTLRRPAHAVTDVAAALIFERRLFDGRWLAEWADTEVPSGCSWLEGLAALERFWRACSVRWGVALAHFERELYRDPAADLDGLWEKLLDKHVGIQPPWRFESVWASLSAIGEEEVVSYTGPLAEAASSALAAAIEEELGGGALSVSPAAGYLLIDKWFLHGARYPWGELIMRVGGGRAERGLE